MTQTQIDIQSHMAGRNPRHWAPPDTRVAVIGSGILRGAHLPGYQKVGVNVVATCDIDAGKARQLADDFDIEHAFGSIEELLAWGEFDVVDVAIPNAGRLQVVSQLAAAGKHILIQKPLSDRLETAKQLVEEAERHGVALAVHQNARYSPAYAWARTLLENKSLGEPYWHVRGLQTPLDQITNWFAQEERYLVCEFLIHDIDALRFLYGEPEAVTASLGRAPGQNFRGELLTSMTVHYPQLKCVIEATGVPAPGSPPRDELWVHGTAGAMHVKSLFTGETDLYQGSSAETAEPATLPCDWSWFPDGFIGPMRDLLTALDENRTPVLNGRDNLKTIAVCEAAYRSDAEGRTIAMSELDAELA